MIDVYTPNDLLPAGPEAPKKGVLRNERQSSFD